MQSTKQRTCWHWFVSGSGPHLELLSLSHSLEGRLLRDRHEGGRSQTPQSCGKKVLDRGNHKTKCPEVRSLPSARKGLRPQILRAQWVGGRRSLPWRAGHGSGFYSGQELTLTRIFMFKFFCCCWCRSFLKASLVVQKVKNLPAMQ